MGKILSWWYWFVDSSCNAQSNSGSSSQARNLDSIKAFTPSTDYELTYDNSMEPSQILKSHIKSDMKVSYISKNDELMLKSPFIKVNEYANISSIIVSTNNVIILEEKWQEIKDSITSIELTIEEYQRRIEIFDDDCEYLLLNIVKGETAKISDNNFILSVAQPFRSVYDQNRAYESDATPSVIDSSHYLVNWENTPENKLNKQKRFEFTTQNYKSIDNKDIDSSLDHRYYTDEK